MSTIAQSRRTAPRRQSWYTTAVGGLAAIVVGAFLLVSPGVTTAIVLVALAIYLLISGIVKVIRAVMHRDVDWVWETLGGVLSAIVGVVALANPAVGTVVAVELLYVSMGLAALVAGVISVVGGIRQRSWGQSLLGLAELALGVVLFAEPSIGLQLLVPLVGITAIGAGFAWMIISFQRT